MGWVVTPFPNRFTSGNDPVLIVQEAGSAPGPVRTGAENLALTGIRFLYRPARSESLFPLRCHAPRSFTVGLVLYLMCHVSELHVT